MPDDPIPGQTPTGYQRTPGGGLKWQPPTAEHLGSLLPQYEVEALVGRGAMGAVYKGRQKSLDRPVAIKILPRDAIDEDGTYPERFKNEAKVMARFTHPAIVAVYDCGETSEGQLYFVMEFVDGTDVEQLIRQHLRLEPEHALAITAHVCDALKYAHEHGVIRRDIKPSNVLVNLAGEVKVADFGLARLDEPGTSGLTQAGKAMGTPDFVAPESLIIGSQVDGRADLYAVGVMLYNMLTGIVPRGAFKPASVIIPGIDPRFDAIATKAMQHDREDRYKSATEMRQDLDVILTTPMVQSGGPGSAAIPQQALAQKPAAKGPQPSGRPGTPASAQKPGSGAAKGKVVTIVPKSKTPLFIGIGAAAVIAVGAFFLLGGNPPDVAPPASLAGKSAGNSTSGDSTGYNGGVNRVQSSAPQLPESPSETRTEVVPVPEKPKVAQASALPPSATEPPAPPSQPAPMPVNPEAAAPATPPVVAEAKPDAPSPAPANPPSPEPAKPVDVTPNPPTVPPSTPPKPAPPVVATLVPFPAGLSPELEKRLATLDAQFQGAADRDALQAYKTAVTKLNASYQSALDRLLAAAIQGGHTDEALAIREEKQLVGKEEMVPESDDEGISANLKKARTTYRVAHQKLGAERDAKLVPLVGLYLKALDALRVEVTKAGQLDDAQKVVETAQLIAAKQEELRNSPGSRVAKAGPAKAETSKAVTRVRHDPKLSRQAAEHAMGKGAEIMIFNGVKNIYLNPGQALPKEDFELHEVTINVNRNIETTDEDLRIYTQATELKSFNSNGGNKLSITKLLPFRDTPGLSGLTIQNYGEITHEDCEAIATLKELKVLGINTGAPSPPVANLPLMIGVAKLRNFSARLSNANPTDLEAINQQTELQTLSLALGAGTDVALLQLENLANLQSLQMSNAMVTEKGLGTLNPNLSKTLKTLNFGPPSTTHDSSKAFRLATQKFAALVELLARGEISAEALSEIGRLKNLRICTLPQATMTPAHVAAICQCKELNTLYLGNGTLTADDIAELKKLRNLTHLKLQDNGIRIDAAAVEAMAGLRQVTKLELPESQVTPPQIEALRQKMPTCEISTVGVYP